MIDIKIPTYVFSCRYEVAPQTRLIDESRVGEDLLSMVRCLYFGETFLGDGKYFVYNYVVINRCCVPCVQFNRQSG